ncbi:MAG: hypothetical protein D8M18_04485 [Bacteroidetes bacterium]|nr:hypothetical protein [Bacteroidota bacterium]
METIFFLRKIIRHCTVKHAIIITSTVIFLCTVSGFLLLVQQNSFGYFFLGLGFHLTIVAVLYFAKKNI